MGRKDSEEQQLLTSNAKPPEQVKIEGQGEPESIKSEPEQKVENSVESGILEAKQTEGDVAVHSVGKIDRTLYQCVTKDIATDEVIITDERIAHIRERHPDDYERFRSLLPELIRNPDYILEDKRPKTAMVMKEFHDGAEHFRLSLRLVTSDDNPEYKNSIITFMKVREREYNRLVRNKKVLYKRE